MCTPRGKHGGAGDGGGLGPEHVRGQAQPIPVQGGRLVALEPALGTDDEDPLPAGGNWQRSHVVAVGIGDDKPGSAVQLGHGRHAVDIGHPATTALGGRLACDPTQPG